MAQHKELIPFIKKWEGGFVNDPKDKGGATNMGVTIATFRQFFGVSQSIEQLKKITEEQWTYIFKKGYWDAFRADEIQSQAVANILVDWAWCSGTVTAIKQVQRLLGVQADGIVGTQTLKAINAQIPQFLIAKIKNARIAFVQNIVKRNPSQKRFITGWLNRIKSF